MGRGRGATPNFTDDGCDICDGGRKKDAPFRIGNFCVSMSFYGSDRLLKLILNQCNLIYTA